MLREMELISAVIAERKTTGAAQRLGMSQPAVSRAIAKIEERTGRTLFEREGGRLIPTADALAIYKRSADIFSALRDLEAFSGTPEHQELTIFAPPTIGRVFLQREVAAFARAHPEILLSFDIVTVQGLASAVAEQQGSIGMMDSNVLHAGVEFETFIETRAVCMLPERHPLASRSEILAEDLDQVDFVSIKRRHSLRGHLEQLFSSAKVNPRTVIETDAALPALEFVGEGLGVSVLNPFPLLLDLPSGVVARPFRPEVPFKTSFVLPANTPPPPAARQFLNFVKKRQRELCTRVCSI